MNEWNFELDLLPEYGSSFVRFTFWLEASFLAGNLVRKCEVALFSTTVRLALGAVFSTLLIALSETFSTLRSHW